MTIKSKQLFILIGDDKTGKTTLQKLLIEKICNHHYTRLPTNLEFAILHPEIKRKYKTISFANRSYQEKRSEYGTVEEYFENHFKPCDISIISSHLIPDEVLEMIRNGKKRFYNVTGVFFSNSIDADLETNSQIAVLEWDEKLLIENMTIEDEELIEKQLNDIADNFVTLLANRTSIS